MNRISNDNLIGVAALLVHAAKIDENYSNYEKNIIKSFIEKAKEEGKPTNEILQEAENLEESSNQLLNFTNKIKNESENFKSSIVEELWQIVLSDKTIDNYESNLIRRICGLIYFPDKLSGEIKLRLMKNIS
tara:strand:- start:373 stop:768 length:396 start_codon:yes stop_codon:yes gene_type:complete